MTIENVTIGAKVIFSSDFNFEYRGEMHVYRKGQVAILTGYEVDDNFNIWLGVNDKYPCIEPEALDYFQYKD